MDTKKPKKVCSVAQEVVIANIKRSQDRKAEIMLKLPTYSYPKEISGKQVRYYHFRNVDPEGRKIHCGGATLAIVEHGSFLHVGLSLCSILDNFGRPRGRHDSAERLDESIRISIGNIKIDNSRKRLHLKFRLKNWTPNGVAADLHLKIVMDYFKTPSPSLLDGPMFF